MYLWTGSLPSLFMGDGDDVLTEQLIKYFDRFSLFVLQWVGAPMQSILVQNFNRFSSRDAQVVKLYFKSVVFAFLANWHSHWHSSSLALYSLRARTSYRKISWTFEAMRFGFILPNRSEMWQAPRQQCCRDACQISQRYDHYNIQSRGFETSRDLVVRRVTAQWKEAKIHFVQMFCECLQN